MRVATFNLENLFTRPTALNGTTDADGRRAIEDHAVLNSIIRKEIYNADDKKRLKTLAKRYGFHERNPPRDALVKLNKVRGALFKQPKGKPLEIVASGRGDWTGWFELREDDIEWEATYNTGRVIAESDADIQIVIEVEDRIALKRFNEQILGAEFNAAYPHVMAIDGNDERGIDVGILSRIPIERMASHIDDRNPNGERTFSRDCPEYDLLLPGGQRIVVLANHFKSKRNGDDAASRERRRLQAERAHAIAQAALARSTYVVIAGDLNDTPDSAPLESLFDEGFTDVQSHETYPQDRPGTFGTGLASGKIDYLILSPDLRDKLLQTGIERRGTWAPRTWDAFDTVTGEKDQASDHHLLWADFDL